MLGDGDGLELDSFWKRRAWDACRGEQGAGFGDIADEAMEVGRLRMLPL